jgi:hypothetical protein
MKSKIRNRLLVLIFALLVLASGIFFFARPRPLPKVDVPTRLVYCAEPNYNAGRVKIFGDSGEAKHTFVIKNDSDKDVQASFASISCHCVTVDCPPEIKAHSSIEVPATMRIAPKDIAFARVEIDILLSDNPKEPLKLSFAGAVQPETALLTTDINLGNVFVGKEKWEEARLLWVGKPLPNGAFKEIRLSDKGAFALRNPKVISEISDDDGKFTLRMEGIEFLVKPEKLGQFSEKATVVLHNGKIFDFTLSYYAQPANIFIPGKYFLAPTMAGGDITFDFVPSGNVGKITFSTDCPALSIDEAVLTGEKYRIKAKYGKSNKETVGRDFSLWAKDSNGKIVATLKLIQIQTDTAK